MGKLKVQPITSDVDVLTRTMMDLMDVPSTKAWDAITLLNAMKKFPFSSEIFYDKILGRWIYTNEPDDSWPKEKVGHNVAGPNFTFCELDPETAMIKGIHYYYHTRIKQ